MNAARLLLDAWLAAVILSLAGITGIFVCWTLASVATLAGAARWKAGQAARLGSLRGRLDENDLADMDEALDRILTQEHGALSSNLAASRA
jgi:hypothetical protein